MYYNNVISQYKINNMSLDIYIEDINTVIEYQGRYFHNNKFNAYNVESRDKDKRRFLSDNNIRLITLNETYDDEKIRVEGDNIYFNANNRSLSYICSIIIIELNKLLDLSIEVPENIEEQAIRSLKIKDIDDSLGKLYPEIAKEWNKDKNGVLTPFKIKPRSNKRVWWRCSKCDYEWITSPAHRVTDGTGCPRCLTLDGKCGGIHMVVAGVNDLETLFPHIADEWDYSKNTIDIKDISHKSNKTAFWVCSKCKKRYIEKVIARTQRNKGCPYCSNEDNVDEGVDLNAYV